MTQPVSFVATHALLLSAGWIVARALFEAGLDRAFAALTLAFGGVLAWMLPLPLAGMLGAGFSGALPLAPLHAAMAFFVVALVFAWTARRGRRAADAAESPRMAGWQRVVGCMLVGAVGWTALSRMVRMLVLPVEPISDGPIYHLYFAVRWLRDGFADLIPTPFGELGATYFPANGSGWFAWLIASWGSERFAKIGQFPFLFVAAFAIYAMGRRVGARPLAASLPAAIWTSTMAALGFAAVPNVDLIFTAFYLIGMYFLCESTSTADGLTARWTIGWLAFGIAMGTKTVGVALLLPWALGCGAIVLFGIRVSVGRKLWLTLVAVEMLVVGCGIWYLRNWLATGNPLFPLQVEVAGRTVFEGCYRAKAMENCQYHAPVEQWSFLLGRMSACLDMRLLPLWGVGVIVGLSTAFARPAADRRMAQERIARGWLAYCALAALGQTATYWFLVPYNTQERFLLPALALGIVPLALLFERWICLAAPAAGLVVWHLTTPGWATRMDIVGVDRLPALLRMPNLAGAPIDIALTLALPAACFTAGWLVWSRRPAMIWLAAGCVGAATTWQVCRADRVFDRDPPARFYPSGDFAGRLYPAWRLLESVVQPNGSRVAYAGTNLPYYLCGSKRSNDVRYLDVTGRFTYWRLDGTLRDRRARLGPDELADSPFPQWHRENPNVDRWLANLRAESMEFLFVARENYHGRSDAPPEADFPIEFEWAKSRPEIFERLGPPSPDGIHEPWAVVFRIKK